MVSWDINIYTKCFLLSLFKDNIYYICIYKMNSAISQTYNYNFTLSQQEKINYFLKSSPKLIKNKFKFDENYYQKLKRFFNNVKSNDYTIKDKYSIDDCGRMYGCKTTMQSISNNLLGFILNNEAYDIDMKNASFTFVKYIIETHFKDDISNFNKLLDYQKNREKYFKYGFNKMKFIEILFCKNSKSYINKDKYDNEFNRLILEIDIFKQLVKDNLELFNIDFKEEKHTGSKLSTIIYHLENDLLQDVLKVYKKNSITPKFDGVVLDVDLDLETVVIKCNKLGEKYGVEFVNKTFDNINIHDDDSLPSYEEDEQKKTQQYLKMKLEFEKKYFMIENPLTFGSQYTTTQGTIKTVLYNESHFRTLIKPYQLKDADGRNYDFWCEWIIDENKRCYKELSWIPDENFNDEQIFNTFTGFKAKLLDTNYDDLIKSNNVIKFLYHLRLLTNDEEEAGKYLLKYLAHLFQKPTELPQTALLFKSYEGVGKDFLTNFMGKILGLDLIKKEENMNNILGNFNSSLMNKMLLQINEINGKVGHEKKDGLKDLITAERLNITYKGKDTFEVPNFLRIFLFTNNLNPISISADNRRYLCFKTGKPKTKKYYITLAEILNDENAIDEIYTFLMKFKLGKFCPHIHRVETSYYKSIQQQNTNPIYEFIYHLTCKKDEYNIINHKQKDIITSKDFEIGYKGWLIENDYHHIESNAKTNKSILCDLGSNATRVSLNGKQTRVYELDIEFLKKEMVEQYKIQPYDDLEEINTLELDLTGEHDEL